jgi:hypothetical protein
VASTERRIDPGIRDDPRGRAVHVTALAQEHGQDKWRKQMARVLDIPASPSRCAPTITGGVGMSLIIFDPDETVAEQLAQLSRMTDKPVDELVNLLVMPLLNQIVADGDTDLMRMVLE